MAEWREVALGDVLTLQRGFDITKKTQRPGLVPVISSAGISSHHDESRAEGPGVVIGRKGSLGTTFFVDGPYWPHDTTLWVRDFKGNAPYFCYLLLKTLLLAGLDVGSSNPTLNRNHVHLLPVRVPPIGTQKRIAATLAAFDELIDINERRIELLEGLAQSVYREWFVRFRFPGHDDVALVDSDLGRIPSGWTPVRVAELANLSRRSVTPARVPGATFEHFSIPAFDGGRLPSRECGLSILSGKYAVDGECVLVSKLNPRIARVWFAMPESDSAITTTEFLPLKGVRVSNAWLWTTLSGDAFRSSLTSAAGGTSTSHQRVKPDDVIGHEVVLADIQTRERFDAIAEPSLREVGYLLRHNGALAATRDLLLPRLVTGRLEISDIELGALLPAEAA